MYIVHLLPALFGDAILIEYGKKADPKYILIDGGPYFAFAQMTAALKAVAPKLKKLELLIITHIDIDHIDGIITLLNQPQPLFVIGEVWFNGYKQVKTTRSSLLGALQGEYISRLIEKHGLVHNKAFHGGPVMIRDYAHLPVVDLPGGMRVTLLSPDVAGLKKLAASWKKQIQLVNAQSSVAARWKKEKRYSQIASMLLGGPNINSLLRTPVRGDKSVANGSSIAFIGEYEGKSCLFAGDAHSEQLLRAIEPGLKAKGRDKLSVNAWKLAHHGSKKSNLDQLMQKISTANMLISSDGSRYKHPDPECIARLITYNGPGLSFHFNYCSKRNETWKDVSLQRKHSFKAFYPKGDHGISVVI